MIYYALSIFISAFLLFQIQPMIAKYILPWFGGTPAVWSTVQMFFQIMLTGGYAYAHWVSQRKTGQHREWIHLVLLGLVAIQMLVLGSIWASPITPDAAWKPVGEVNPIWEIFKLLMISVGPAYFLLSANSPMMQAWFNRSFPSRSPYFLYALSNIGSLLGLISYPVLVEPRLTVQTQGIWWSVGFGLFAGLSAFGAVRALRLRADDSPIAESALEARVHPKAGFRILWILLSACASILFLAVTSHITQEVAVIPFLWVLPLTIYLLTFIFAFSSERWYSRQVFLILLVFASFGFVYVLFNRGAFTIPTQLTIYSFMLFVACMICHGELYRLRPDPAHLTHFYLMVSVGGALGGIFVNFVAPNIFKGFWELPLGFIFCWLLLQTMMVVKKVPAKNRALQLANQILSLSGLTLVSIAMILYITFMSSGALFVARNFYGVVRVQERQSAHSDAKAFSIVHGVTVHGVQFEAAFQRDVPIGYYYERTGVGLALLNNPHRGHGMRVGVLGLGAGTLAAYGQPGDVYRFYEINPIVIDLAQGQGGFFSFLPDSPAKIEIVPGDARISLEHEISANQPQQFDVLVLDTFSSDAIPVHLLDKEAFVVYLQHLKSDGVIAVHITNASLDLKPVVWNLAQAYHLSLLSVESKGDGGFRFPTSWMLLSREPASLNIPAIEEYSDPLTGYSTNIPLWTDDYSNLFLILR